MNVDAAAAVQKSRSAVASRILKGLASFAFGQIVSVAQTVILVPLFISAWGASEYGQWLGLTSFVAYLSLLDLGGQNYIGNLLAAEHVHGDDVAFGRRLSEGVSLFLAISL